MPNNKSSQLVLKAQCAVDGLLPVKDSIVFHMNATNCEIHVRPFVLFFYFNLELKRVPVQTAEMIIQLVDDCRLTIQTFYQANIKTMCRFQIPNMGI